MLEFIFCTAVDLVSTPQMIFQLYVITLGTDVVPLLGGKDTCTGYRDYWNEDTAICGTDCDSGFYSVDENVKVCSTCDSVLQFVTEEKRNGIQECINACPDSAFEDVNISDILYRQCTKKSSCDYYVYEDIIVGSEL